MRHSAADHGQNGVEPEVLLSISDRNLRNLAKASLEDAGCQVIWTGKTDDLIELIESSDNLLVCLDRRSLSPIASFGGRIESEMAGQMSDIQIRAPFVVLLEQADQSLALEMMSKGARDCILYDDVYTGIFSYKIRHVLGQLTMERKIRYELAACKASNRTLTNLIDSFPGMAYRGLNDEHRTMLFVNKGCEELTGYASHEVKHNASVSYMQMVHEDDRSRLAEEVRQALSAQRPYQLLYRLRTREGQERWVWEKGSAISSEEDGIQVLEGFVLDVTVQQAAYRDLKANEERFRTIYDMTPVAMQLYDASGNWMQMNRASYEMFGVPPGHHPISFNILNEVSVVPDAGRKLAQGQTLKWTGTYDFDRKKKDTGLLTTRSGLIHINATIIPLKSTGKAPEGYLARVQDITETEKASESLRRSEYLYRLLAENTTDVIFTTDMDLSPTYVSPSVINLTGFSVDEWMRRSLEEALTPSSQQTVREALMAESQSMEGGTIDGLRLSTLQIEFHRKDGATSWAEVRASFLQGQDGTPVGIVGVMTDITERKKAEERLRNSEERFRALIENSSDTVIILDANGSICYQSPAGQRLFGYGNDEVLGLPMTHYIHPDDLENIVTTFARLVAESGAAASLETRVRHADGSWRIVEGLATNLLHDPAVSGIVVNYRDVTSQNRATEALEESERRYRLLAENITDVIYSTDMNGHPTYMSPSITRLLGYTVEEAMQRSLEESLTPASREIVRQKLAVELLKELSAGPEEARENRHELEFYRKDGSTIWVEATVSSLRDTSGKPIELLGSMHDITERKLAEIRLHRALADVASSNAELQQFAYVSSHHLQEPIRQVVSHVQLLARHCQDRLDKEAEEFIAYAVDGARRMHQLINDFLSYSAMSTRHGMHEPVDCNLVLHKVMADLKPAITETEAVITSDPLPMVVADQVQVQELLKHLMDNAIKFRTEEPPRIHITADRQGDGWLFTMQDNGVGIDREFLDRIFLIFNRLHAWNKYSGTGIGLPICKRIVEQHGGTIWADSEPGQGTKFFFIFPDVPEGAHPLDDVEPWLDDIKDIRIRF